MSKNPTHVMPAVVKDASEGRVDLSFPLSGVSLPLDAGYALFSAVCRVAPHVHGDEAVAIHPVRGRVDRERQCLMLDRTSALTFRIFRDEVAALDAPLRGETLEIDGEPPVMLGKPILGRIAAAPELLAETVVIARCGSFAGFLSAVERQIEAMEVHAELRVDDRRALCVHGSRVSGYRVILRGLSREDSLRVQARGIGGRQRFGCGVFVPLVGGL